MELQSDSKPYYANTYHEPRAHIYIFNKEGERHLQLRMLKK